MRPFVSLIAEGRRLVLQGISLDGRRGETARGERRAQRRQCTSGLYALLFRGGARGEIGQRLAGHRARGDLRRRGDLVTVEERFIDRRAVGLAGREKSRRSTTSNHFALLAERDRRRGLEVQHFIFSDVTHLRPQFPLGVVLRLETDGVPLTALIMRLEKGSQMVLRTYHRVRTLEESDVVLAESRAERRRRGGNDLLDPRTRAEI